MVAPGVTTLELEAGRDQASRSGRHAGLQRLSRLSGRRILHFGQRAGGAWDALDQAGAEGGRHRFDRYRRRPRRLFRRFGGDRRRSGGFRRRPQSCWRSPRSRWNWRSTRCGRATASRTSATLCSRTSRRMDFRWCASSSAMGSASRSTRSRRFPTTATRGRGPRLKEGMVLAIEPMVNMGKPAVRILEDGWTAVSRDGSLSAHFEHTVAVGANGAECSRCSMLRPGAGRRRAAQSAWAR